MYFSPVIAFLGRLLALFASGMLITALVALGYGESGDAYVFSATASVTLFFGIAMLFATRGSERAFRRRGELLLAIVSWPVLAVFGAAPFLLLGAAATPTDAFFEAMSGLTTTGASVLGDPDALGRGVLFWRASLQWIGGLGTIVLAVSVLPTLGAGGMQVFHSAMPHGDHATIEARLRRSALVLSWIYGMLTAFCSVALWLAGMTPFDAVAHALSTLSTGGFSTHAGGLDVYDSPLIEAVLMVFMLLGALNFTLYWALIHGRLGVMRIDPECRPMLWTAMLASLAAAYLIAREGDVGGLEALRQGAFATISAFTTTGFVNGMGGSSPAALVLLLLILMFVGGSSGSTAGGVKLMRARLAFRQGRRELARLSHPHGVIGIHYGRSMVSERALQALSSFFILFTLGLATLAVVLAIFGLDVTEALPMALATLTNAGAGLPLVAGPDTGYALLSDPAKWVVCLGMLLGRLELVALVALLAPMFWKR